MRSEGSMERKKILGLLKSVEGSGLGANSVLDEIMNIIQSTLDEAVKDSDNKKIVDLKDIIEDGRKESEDLKDKNVKLQVEVANYKERHEAEIQVNFDKHAEITELKGERDHLFQVLVGRAMTENDKAMEVLSGVRPSYEELKGENAKKDRYLTKKVQEFNAHVSVLKEQIECLVKFVHQIAVQDEGDILGEDDIYEAKELVSKHIRCHNCQRESNETK